MADWTSVAGLAFTAGNFSGGLAGWFLKSRKDARQALPTLRWNGGMITIVNRLDEDLTLERIDATAPFVTRMPVNRDAIVYTGPSLDFTMLIKPKSEAAIYLELQPSHVPPAARFTFSSSAGTLRRKRMRLNMFVRLNVRAAHSGSPRLWSRISSFLRRR